jgi:site-specific recombinase XerD
MQGDMTVLTLEDGLTAYRTYAMAEGKSPKTIRWFMSSVQYFAQFLGPGAHQIADITGNDFRRFMIALRDKPKFSDHPFNRPMTATLSAQSVSTYCRGIRAYFGFLEREGFISLSPLSKVKLPKTPNLVVPTLSTKEVNRLLAQPDKNTPIGFRDYALLLTLIDTGGRVSEIVNMKLGDIDFEQNFITVLGKGNKQRLLPFRHAGRQSTHEIFNAIPA